MQIPGLFIMEGERGRGVFTGGEIATDSVIELCPVIVLPAHETSMIHRSSLHDYYFLWDDEVGSIALALGYGSLYNHSSQPNAIFEVDHSSQSIRFSALRTIQAGEEVCIDYHAGDDGQRQLWFVER